MIWRYLQRTVGMATTKESSTELCLRDTLTLIAFSDEIQNAYGILMFTLKSGWIYIHNCLDIDINATVKFGNSM